MRLAAEGWPKEWQTLISTIMSAQSRDETTIPIALGLFNRYPSVKELALASYPDVLFLLKSLNYNRTKAKNVILCAQDLMCDYNGDVPHDFEKLIALPGVGRKTANVVLSEYGHHGLAVDTHVYQLARALGWTNANHPHKVEDDLKKLFPKKYWVNINPILVRFGKLHTSRKKKNQLLEQIKEIN